MKADIERIAREILKEIGDNISAKNIERGSEIEVMAGFVNEDYFISIGIEKEGAGVNLCRRENLGRDFDYVLKVLERVRDGLVYEKYRAPIILKYIKDQDKQRL